MSDEKLRNIDPAAALLGGHGPAVGPNPSADDRVLVVGLCRVGDAKAVTTPGLTETWPFSPCNWDLKRFRVAVEEARGRPLLLVSAPIEPASSLWLTAHKTDSILYSGLADPRSQLQAVAHQAAHMLLGHRPVETDLDELFPHLDLAMLSTVLVIRCYSEADEQVATELASRVVADS